MNKIIPIIFCSFILISSLAFSQNPSTTVNKGKVIRNCNYPENESSQSIMLKKKNELNAISQNDKNVDVKRIQKVQEILDVDKTLKCTQDTLNPSTDLKEDFQSKEIHYETK
jgi:hypothetical protein